MSGNVKETENKRTLVTINFRDTEDSVNFPRALFGTTINVEKFVIKRFKNEKGQVRYKFEAIVNKAECPAELWEAAEKEEDVKKNDI